MTPLGLGLGLGFGSGVGGSQYDADATAYFSALVNKPDNTDALTVNTFIETLKANGIWTLLDDVKLLANWDNTDNIHATDSTCLFNMVDPTKYKGTPVNTPVTTKYTGVYGNGLSCIDSGFNMATAGVKSSQDDIMICVAIKSAYSESNKVQSGGFISNGIIIARNYSGFRARLNSIYNIYSEGITTASILYAARGGEIDIGKTRGYVNGSPTSADIATPSTSVNDINIAILAAKIANTPTYGYHTKDTLALHLIGRVPPTDTNAKILILHNAISTMLNALYARS